MGQHLIDASPWPIRPGTVTLVGRGQANVLQRVRGLSGAVCASRTRSSTPAGSARATPVWLVTGRRPRTIELYRRFVQLLERELARHHDAGHYADQLAVPAATLTR